MKTIALDDLNRLTANQTSAISVSAESVCLADWVFQAQRQKSTDLFHHSESCLGSVKKANQNNSDFCHQEAILFFNAHTQIKNRLEINRTRQGFFEAKRPLL